MWITSWKTPETHEKCGNMVGKPMFLSRGYAGDSCKKIHTADGRYPVCCVDKVENYFPSRFSPISTTFPAPIVINKSPSIQFSSKNFSISSKEGK